MKQLALVECTLDDLPDRPEDIGEIYEILGLELDSNVYFVGSYDPEYGEVSPVELTEEGSFFRCSCSGNPECSLLLIPRERKSESVGILADASAGGLTAVALISEGKVYCTKDAMLDVFEAAGFDPLFVPSNESEEETDTDSDGFEHGEPDDKYEMEFLTPEDAILLLENGNISPKEGTFRMLVEVDGDLSIEHIRELANVPKRYVVYYPTKK